MQHAYNGVLRSRQLVQLWVCEVEIALAHRALHVGNRVAHHATQSGLRLGSVHDLLDGRVHQPAVEHSMIVRSEEHTSELQSRPHLVCRLLLEKKKRRHGTRFARYDSAMD